uniref:Uncharacterized protein n=1 Tax=Oryza punctata TaxID=4537 RepID=A0A0E0JDS8_ORYPU
MSCYTSGPQLSLASRRHSPGRPPPRRLGGGSAVTGWTNPSECAAETGQVNRTGVAAMRSCPGKGTAVAGGAGELDDHWHAQQPAGSKLRRLLIRTFAFDGTSAKQERRKPSKPQQIQILKVKKRYRDRGEEIFRWSGWSHANRWTRT